MVLIVLCFGVFFIFLFLCYYTPYARFHIYLNLGSRVATYCEIAAHFAYNVFSYYKYLIVSLVFATSVYGVIAWIA